MTSRIKVAGREIVCVLSSFGELERMAREPGGMTPFHQQGLDATASGTDLTLDGKVIDLTLLPVGISGGAAAVSSTAGIYSRWFNQSIASNSA